MTTAIRVLGIDPGLRRTGWGVIDMAGSRLTHVANGAVTTASAAPLAERLAVLHRALVELVATYQPNSAAVELVFVNADAAASLKLGQARAAALLAPALAGLAVAEYAPNLIKKAVVGAGHAEKDQIRAMIARLLPTADVESADAADALAVAICHAHMGHSRLGRLKAEARA